MCDDRPAPQVPRRAVLAGMAGLPFLPLAPDRTQRPRGVQQTTAGVVRSALHVHTSFSEGGNTLTGLASTSTLASMESQVASLATMGVDLCYFTDHDHRMAAEIPSRVPTPFPGREDLRDPHWAYTPEQDGAAVGGVTRMTQRGLEAAVTAGSAPAWRGMFVDCEATSRDYRSTLAGVAVAVTMRHLGPAGWTELRLRTSYHPARGRRTAGSYEIHYLFDPSARARATTRRGLAAVVTVPVPAGSLHRAVVHPANDLGAVFPDFGPLVEDNGLHGIWVGAGAAAGTTGGTLVRALELQRSIDGPAALRRQHVMMDELSILYPEVALGAGLEASYARHINWFSPTVGALDVVRPRADELDRSYLVRLVEEIRASGGIASYNHPFGASVGSPLTGAVRADRLAAVARELLGHRLYGCDVLEVGYGLRGSMDIGGHLDLWDVLLSAGLRVMADGVSDDHGGTVTSWTDGPNQYVTDVISASSDPGHVTRLLSHGRAFVSLYGRFGGFLDLAVGATPMGGSATASGRSVELEVTADALPADGALRVVQIKVHGDPARLRPPVPVTDRRYAASAVVGGRVRTSVPNVRSYVRAEVLDAGGARVAFSNPLWLAD